MAFRCQKIFQTCKSIYNLLHFGKNLCLHTHRIGSFFHYILWMGLFFEEVILHMHNNMLMSFDMAPRASKNNTYFNLFSTNLTSWRTIYTILPLVTWLALWNSIKCWNSSVCLGDVFFLLFWSNIWCSDKNMRICTIFSIAKCITVYVSSLVWSGTSQTILFGAFENL